MSVFHKISEHKECNISIWTNVSEAAFCRYVLYVCDKGTSINDVPRCLAIFDIPTLSYSITSDFGGYLGPPYLP